MFVYKSMIITFTPFPIVLFQILNLKLYLKPRATQFHNIQYDLKYCLLPSPQNVNNILNITTSAYYCILSDPNQMLFVKCRYLKRQLTRHLCRQTNVAETITNMMKKKAMTRYLANYLEGDCEQVSQGGVARECFL